MNTNAAGEAPVEPPVRPAALAGQLRDCAWRIDLGPENQKWMPPDVELMRRAASLLDAASAVGIQQERVIMEQEREIAKLRDTLAYAEAALSDIGDADREPGDDLAWCEARAAEALPRVRAALVA